MILPSLKNPIRLFAVLCVGCIAGFIMWTASWVLAVLASPGWCRTALGAEKVSGSDGTIKGLDACVGLLTIQLKALATNSYIFGGVMALCLLVLIVIVIAGAKLDLKAGAEGVDMKVSQDASAAGQQVAAVAKDKADEITERGNA